MKILGTIVIPENVTKIGEGAFRNLTGLKTIIIPGSVKEIASNAFSGNETLENVRIEEGVQKIGEYAFENCRAIKSIKIADSVNEIGRNCFSNCTSLVEFNFPNALTIIQDSLLYNTGLTEIIIPEGILEINRFAFAAIPNLTKVSIPKTVTTIKTGVFRGSYNLENITIDTSNENYSFSSGGLTSADGKILYHVLTNTNQINIPPTVETIETSVLEILPKKVDLIIPESVKVINTMLSSNIKSITVAEENQYFKTEDGNLYDKDMTILYKYTKNATEFTMPNTVTTIKGYAFSGNSNLSELILSENLENLDGYGIFMQTLISRLNLPSKLKMINANAFLNKDIAITIAEGNPNFMTPDGTLILSKDQKELIRVSKNLETYDISSTVEKIGDTAFYSISNLTKITIPNTVKSIGETSFYNCSNLPKIEIPASVETIGGRAFNGCGSLRKIIIDKKDGEITGAPWGCPYGLRAIKWK